MIILKFYFRVIVNAPPNKLLNTKSVMLLLMTFENIQNNISIAVRKAKVSLTSHK